MEYKIVWDNIWYELETKVNALLKQGWKCQGGLCSNGKNFYQAMVKDKD